MKLLKKMLHKLNGLHFKQEYLCLAEDIFEQPLHACLIEDGKVIKDITNHHGFVGYSPLIISLYQPPTDPGLPSAISIIFTKNEYQPGVFVKKWNVIASIFLRKIREQSAGNGTIFYYEGARGSHRFISSFYQFIIWLYNRIYQKKAGNVFLPGNLYTQVQIAYSLPRKISMITVGENDLFNLFPTDLHGPVNQDYYIISLRHDGRASRQVMSAGRLLLAEVRCDFYRTAYALGKNHMQKMKGRENFPFSNEVSTHLKLPITQSALSYRELELLDSFTYGIHRVMLFKILFRQRFQERPSTLVHIHNVYATWRQNNRLPGNYLLR